MTNHVIRPFSAEEVERIKAKTVYLAGTEDPFMKMGGSEAMTDSGVNVTFYDGAGHGLNHELAASVNEKIIHVLTSGY